MGYPKKGKPVRDPFLFQIQFFGKDVFGQQEKIGNRHPVTQVTAIVPLVPASATHWMVWMLRISVEMTCKINMMTR